MKAHELLERLAGFLDAGKRERRARADSMKDVLRKLKKKERSIEEKIRHEGDARERERLERKLGVVHAQRKKGVRALRKLGRS